MDYSKLSDFEINATIHFGHMPCFKVSANYCSFETLIGEMRGFGNYHYKQNFPDYCNNPADAWPIISANRISVEYDSEDQCDVPAEWVTAYGIDGLKVHVVAHQPCDKALRSAMIVFLMMQESANVQTDSTR